MNSLRAADFIKCKEYLQDVMNKSLAEVKP
jgi:hypothetical protein